MEKLKTKAKSAIIIGGGIAGCSSAYALAKRGVQVTLMERNTDIASEASGNPLAMLYPRLSGDVAASQFALAGYLYSLALYKTLQLDNTQFDNCGMLQLGFNTRELARIQKVASQHHSSDIVKYVTAIEAASIAGISIAHDALYFPDAAWARPQALCQRLTQHKNISIMRAHNITSIAKTSHAFVVHGDNGFLMKADLVVIANANDAQQLCPDLPLSAQAVRGQVSLLKATETSSRLKVIVCSDGYFSPAAFPQYDSYSHCLGATFSTEMMPAVKQSDLPIQHEDHLENLQKLKHISPQLHAELHDNISGGRVSLRCTASDYWPLVGKIADASALRARPPRPSACPQSLPWLTGLYMNIAHGSKGFTTAPLCAEILACTISGESPPISSELVGLMNPNRFLLRDMGLKQLAKTLPP